MDTRTDILIVGGGFSGTALVANLARMKPTLHLTVVERSSIGLFGMAYRTRCTDHVLNVPASGMSAFTDLPNDFIEWAAGQGEILLPGTFAARALYAQYLNSLMNQARSTCCVEVIHNEVISLSKQSEGWLCTLLDGANILAKTVVLAFGNCFPVLPQELKAVEGHPSLIIDPWAPIAHPSAGGLERVGIIGSGLTAVDVVLSLEAAGFQGHYDIVSRHGLLPNPHRSGVVPIPAEQIPKPKNSVRTLLKEFRSAAALAAESGSDWRAIFDSIRPRVAEYWLALDQRERLRFLSHSRVFWDVHRHRTPPEADAMIKDLIAQGRITITKGCLRSSVAIGKEIAVRVAAHGIDDLQDFRWDLVFNCTGSPANVKRWASPLVNSLQATGYAVVDQTEMGFLCDDQGKVISISGEIYDDLYLLGILRRGQLWESTAVPDLRRQASTLAGNLT